MASTRPYDPADLAKKVGTTFRMAVGLTGLVALVVGILILVWPVKSFVAVAVFMAIYAVIVGLVYAAMTFAVREKSGWWRLGHIVLAIVFVAAGVAAFSNLAATAAFLAVFLGVMIGVMWVVDGFVSLSLLSDVTSKGWTIAYALLSIAAGIVLFISPVWGVAILWWVVGISLVVLGVTQIVRAATFGRRSRNELS